MAEFQLCCQLPQDSNPMMMAQVSHSARIIYVSDHWPNYLKRKLPLGHSDLVCNKVTIETRIPLHVTLQVYQFVTPCGLK